MATMYQCFDIAVAVEIVLNILAPFLAVVDDSDAAAAVSAVPVVVAVFDNVTAVAAVVYLQLLCADYNVVVLKQLAVLYVAAAAADYYNVDVCVDVWQDNTV